MDGGTLTALTDAAQTLGVVGVGLIISLVIVMMLVVLVLVPQNRAQVESSKAQTETNKLLLAHNAETAVERRVLQTQVNDLNKTVGVLQDQNEEQVVQITNLTEIQRQMKADFEHELAAARAEIADLSARLTTANTSLTNANATISELTRQNEALNKRLNAIEAERNTLKDSNAAKDDTIARLKTELKGVHEELDKLRGRVRDLEKKPDTGALVDPADPPPDMPDPPPPP